MLRPFAHPVECCWMLLRVVAQSLKPVKLFSQQLPKFLLFRLHSSSNIVGATHAHYACFTKTYGLYPSHVALQVPTLLGVVASVCTPLPTRTQQLPTLLAQQCWELLRPFVRSLKSHWRKTKKEITIIIMYTFCLSCPSATFALQHGGFVSTTWMASYKGPIGVKSNACWLIFLFVFAFPKKEVVPKHEANETKNICLFVCLFACFFFLPDLSALIFLPFLPLFNSYQQSSPCFSLPQHSRQA